MAELGSALAKHVLGAGKMYVVPGMGREEMVKARQSKAIEGTYRRKLELRHLNKAFIISTIRSRFEEKLSRGIHARFTVDQPPILYGRKREGGNVHEAGRAGKGERISSPIAHQLPAHQHMGPSTPGDCRSISIGRSIDPL